MSDGQDGTEFETSYDRCDICGQWGTVIGCPSMGEEIEHGFWDADDVCESCCSDAFDDDIDSCLTYLGDCPRVEGLLLKKFDSIVNEYKLTKSQKFSDFYLDERNFLGIGVLNANPSDTFKGEEIESDSYFDGIEYSFLQVDNRKFAYSKELVDRALTILKGLGESQPDRAVIINGDFALLALKGEYFSAVITNIGEFEYLYSTEREDFVSNVLKGYEFFKNEIRNDLLVVDTRVVRPFDWEAIDYNEFEELCWAILNTFENISDCNHVSGSGDEGRDLTAMERINTIAGTELRKWLIQCKHYPNGTISKEDIDNLDNLKRRFGFQVYCLMTSGRFGPNATRLLDSFAEDHNIKRWDKKFLEDCLIKHPEILAKFPKLCP